MWIRKKIKPFCICRPMDIPTAVSVGLGVGEYETNVESCDVGTVDKNKWRMKHSVENNSSSEWTVLITL